jgi:fatty-acyl-CoA synthase
MESGKFKFEHVAKTDGKRSYVSTTSNVPLIGLTIGSLLERGYRNDPDKVVYIFHKNDGLHLTFRDVYEKAQRMAQNFLQMGLKKGDRICIMLPFTHELVIIYMACALTGILAVPLDPTYGMIELEHMLESVQPAAFVSYNLAPFPERRDFIIEMFKNVSASDKVAMKYLIVLEDGSNDFKFSFKDAKTMSYKEVADVRLSDTDMPLPYVDRDDPAFIIFSSGTTSKPKGTVQTHASLVNTGHQLQHLFNHDNVGTRICSPFALYHIGAITTLIGALVWGRTYVYPSLAYDQKDILESVEAYKCDALNAPPKIYDLMLQNPIRHNYDLSTLKHAFTGSQAVPVELIERVKSELNIDMVLNGYGMTEMGITNITTLDDGDMRGMKSIGKPLPFLEMKIVHPETREIVPLLEEGELMVRGYSVFKGYWNNPEMTQTVLDESGWFRTADVVKMDADGYLYFQNRIKDVLFGLNSGRMEIYPSQVEDELRHHSNVLEVVVFGIAINAYASHVCAWIKLKDKETPTTADELQSFLRANRLPEFKIPAYIKFVDEFPINGMNKYVRTEMSKAFKDELKL